MAKFHLGNKLNKLRSYRAASRISGRSLARGPVSPFSWNWRGAESSQGLLYLCMHEYRAIKSVISSVHLPIPEVRVRCIRQEVR